jgi:hypothetical protein
VSPSLFAWFLFAGAAAIALWIVVRFPDCAPQGPRGVSISLGLAVVTFLATPPAIMSVGGAAGAIVAAMCVALPGGVFILLVIAWMMLWVIRSIQPHIR